MKRFLALAIGLFSVIGFTSMAQAANFHVANNGVDSSTCGDGNAPCRSISLAIANANDGDRIIVGPGRYGDLNSNGTVESGEEAAEQGFGCDCLIKVNKRIKLESSDGAGATMIDQGAVNVAHGVRIQVSGVEFGKEKRGFTFNRRLTIDIGTSGVEVVDNVANAASDGIFVNGSDHKIVSNMTTALFVEGDGHKISENFASGGVASFLFNISGSGHLVNSNLASERGIFGFVIDGSGHEIIENTARDGLLGFRISGTGHTVSRNVSNSTNVGIEVQGSDHLVTENIINALEGGLNVVNGSGHEIRRNSIVGNRGFGIEARTNGVTITQNNIFGNDSIANCGLFNNTGTSLAAPNNFWGAASGPGPDPADAVCNSASSTTTVAPVATRPFNIPASGAP